jgi:ATP-binding cassette subfamily B protein
MAFPFYKQPDEMDCGPTCLRMIIKYHGKDISLYDLRMLSQTTREGTSLMGLREAAEKLGFEASGYKTSFEYLQEIPLPCIIHWNQSHFVVLYKISRRYILIADPSHGLLKYKIEDFLKSWQGLQNEGVVLSLTPTITFTESISKSKSTIKGKPNAVFLLSYLIRYKQMLFQLILGLLAGSLLQLIFPFLTQSIIDVGVQTKDINFIHLVLFGQLMLFFGRTTIEIIRSWILMHISSRINISLVSDFFVKVMKLPIAYFDVKMTGDIMQRILDHHRIETFLTSVSLNVFFSLVNLIVFGFVLAYYNLSIFTIFFIGSLLYLIWILFFLKRRADLDFKRFTQNSQNQNKIIELINGMQEIKLHNAERQKRWQWEQIQVKLFKINLKGLALEQMQNTGSGLINELKNIFVTFYSAKLVIEGEITLGMMLSISYITGQLNNPLLQLVTFIQSLQDTRLSLERLSEIHNMDDEESENVSGSVIQDSPIYISNLTFQYIGTYSDPVLKNLNLEIPANKVTAIVGSSGSGKTTLMKLLLKFYEPQTGHIMIGDVNLNTISPSSWRTKCGVVMQEGYIFSDTIANNIAVGDEKIDMEKINYAATIANIKDYIDSLPMGFNTKIGMEGAGLSTGQKQRILIARSVYKNPDYLFFDEATSALDSVNEKIIMNNLNLFFKNKTVIIIAHRLSTVKNADKIIVLSKGKIIESGNHSELTSLKGTYYELVKNQLELGN